MASLVRTHPKIAMLAAAATAFFWFPLLLITSPFLLFTSLFSMGFITVLKCLFHLSLSLVKSLTRSSNRRRLGSVQYAGFQGHGSLEDVCRGEEDSLRENRVHEYLEDQLKNLNVLALGRSESGEELLPCSFSFGSDDHMET